MMQAMSSREPAAQAEAAKRLGVSQEALSLYDASDVVDLHVDSFLWSRMVGYDILSRHGAGPTGARLFHQVDLPRLREAGISGVLWSITTNPWRPSAQRPRTFQKNLERLQRLFAAAASDVSVVRNLKEYEDARRAGRHAAFIVIQGGNALDHDASSLDLIPGNDVLLVTLVHMTSSRLGGTSSPFRLLSGHRGLTPFGAEYVQRLNQRRIFVDLAHIDRAGFFAAAAASDPTQPLIVSHTGVAGVHPHWRNIDDEQLRLVAARGGVVGVIFHSAFLGSAFGRGRAERIVDHLEHIVRVAGEEVPALGSDWDGMVITPADMPTCLELPRLVQIMLERGWPAPRIQKVLGGNFLAALAALRGA